MSTLNDIFGGQHQIEEEVIILPFRGGTGGIYKVAGINYSS